MPRHKDAERTRVITDTRMSLLDAATREFAKEGYHGANVDRISKTAGFAKGTIYNYFPSKRALMLALIDLITASHHDFVAGRVRAEDDPVRRLRRFFQAGSEWISHNLPQGKVMLTILNGPDLEFKQRMQQGYQPMHQLLIADVLQPGVERGMFRQVDPGATAGLLMTLYLGLGSTVDEQGRSRLAPAWIAGFVLDGLARHDPMEPEGKGMQIGEQLSMQPHEKGYAVMNALVIYYSQFGNTQQVAEAVAEELQLAGVARTLRAEHLTAADLRDIDLVVFGTPTHKMNLPQALRPMLEEMPSGALQGVSIAAFDTSYKMSALLARFTAARRLDRKLRRLGGKRIVPPETFHVHDHHEGPLYDGEIERAKTWASTILAQYRRRSRRQ